MSDPSTLYYGDNLDVLRKHVRDETIDLCYIDPPFNSKRNYNQMYNNNDTKDLSQARAFSDTWVWDERANEGFHDILANEQGRFSEQAVDLIRGLQLVLRKGSLLAYLVSMTLRITEIHRVLKPTGSFYLHCDPTASHYLKILLDAIFVAQGGDFRNEIVWSYESGGRATRDFPRKHDVILRYTKSKKWIFNADQILLARTSTRHNHMKCGVDSGGRSYRSITSNGKVYTYYDDEGVIPTDVWADIGHWQQRDPRRLGYPTQKPDPLLERIIASSSNEGDTVLDAYCGCGTTIAVAQRLNRRWIGIDITYQALALALKRLHEETKVDIAHDIVVDGIPRDMASARALANKRDDRARNEFEKWAVLTYTNNRARITEKRGADGGIDGVAYFMTGLDESAKIMLQVKSGHVSRGDVAALRGDMQREGALLAVLITLEPPTAPMVAEAKAVPPYSHPLMGRNYDAIQMVTVRDIIENGARLDMPMSLEVLKTARGRVRVSSGS